MPRRRSDAALFWGLLLSIVVGDVITKRLAVSRLAPRYSIHPVIGDWLQLRLVYNQGAAFGISLGGYSRWIFIALTIAAVLALARMWVHTREGQTARTIALAMVIGGAIGNLLDRLASSQGVVDFIDMGIGTHRFWTYNVADMGVSLGAILLAIVIWREEEADARARAVAASGAPAMPPVRSDPAPERGG